MECGKHALASGCNVSGRCKSNIGQTGSAKPKYYQEMEFESLENDGDIEAGLINEKETVCNKSAPNSVFGGSSIHLKNENVIIG